MISSIRKPNVPRIKWLSRLIVLSAGLALIIPSALGDGFVKGPYLNKVGTSAAQIIVDVGAGNPVQPEPPLRVRVKFGLKGSMNQEAEAHKENTDIKGQFIARLTDLRPDSEYAYQVEGPDVISSQTYHFTTAPDKPRPFSFLVFADTQSVGKPHAAVVAAAIKYISAAPGKPSFLIHLGDHVQTGGDEKLWDKYFSNSRDLLAEICEWPVAGNHDYIKEGERLFRGMFGITGSNYYAFNHAGTSFIILDTNKFDREQQEWLVKTLASIPVGQGPIVVAMHHHLFTSGDRKKPKVRLRDTLTPIFERHGVDVVLSGHEHHYERTKPINGVTYIIAGSAGGPARKIEEDNKGSDFTAHIASIENFMVFSVDGKKMGGKSISASGEVFDTLPEFDWSANDPKL